METARYSDNGVLIRKDSPTIKRNIYLSEEQGAALNQAADIEAQRGQHDPSKTRVADALLHGYLKRAFGIDYPEADRHNPGRRGKSSKTGIYSFAVSENQARAISQALTTATMSFAQLFEAAAADQMPTLYGIAWPARDRPNLPYGRRFAEEEVAF